MVSTLILALGFFISTALSQEPGECHMTDAWPPPDSSELMEFDIDLDAPASTRWNGPVLYYADEIKDLLSFIFNSTLVDSVRDRIQAKIQELLSKLPNDYGEEMSGIAATLEVDVAEIFLVNIAYELMGVCTSIVAQNTNNQLFHGRNLDFGLWPAFNWTDFQWELTSKLRDTLFQCNFYRGGNLLYKSVAFGGYVGLLTGVRKEMVSITVNSRYDNNFDKYLVKWLEDPFDKDQLLALVTRMAIEDHDSYDDAISFMQDSSLVSPAYIIAGGMYKNQGMVMSFGPEKTMLDVWEIPEALPQNASEKWYVLETNYDHWEQPPIFDDRRYPAMKCMDIVGEENIDASTLYNVLHGKPNRNRLTTYTAIMSVSQGELMAWKQWCDDPNCSPW